MVRDAYLFKFIMVESTLLFRGEALNQPIRVRGSGPRSGVQAVATLGGVQGANRLARVGLYLKSEFLF